MKYLELSLRERMQSKLKSCRVQSPFVPKVGNVVLIKDDLPRSTWKLGRIVKLISSIDKEVRSAKVQVSSGHILGRPLNLLYPLEVDNDNEISETKTFEEKESIPKDRPQRVAAEIARKKIKSLCK